MPDCVIDASVVAMANGDIAKRRPGNAFDRRIVAIERVVRGQRRLRYNPKLLGEYQRLIRERRNDVIELFFTVLAERSILVRRNTLSRQEHALAVNRCGWPSHDQHLLAAALDGIDPTIVVTETYLARCASRILTRFAVHIENVG